MSKKQYENDLKDLNDTLSHLRTVKPFTTKVVLLKDPEKKTNMNQKTNTLFVNRFDRRLYSKIKELVK